MLGGGLDRAGPPGGRGVEPGRLGLVPWGSENGGFGNVTVDWGRVGMKRGCKRVLLAISFQVM